jgi:hypothetical protein
MRRVARWVVLGSVLLLAALLLHFWLGRHGPLRGPFGYGARLAWREGARLSSLIKGEKKQEKEEKDERHHRVERSYGAFTRSVRLPVGVDGSKVNATFKNGLLTITLPKTPAAKGLAIPIKTD